MGKKKNYKQNNLRTVKLPAKEKKKNLAAWILVILMVIWSIGSVLGTLAYFRGSGVSTLSAAADIDDTTDLNPSIEDFDINDYPSANYFDVSQVLYDSTSTHGVTAVSNGLVNSIVITNRTGGQASISLGSTLRTICPDMLAGDIYTLTMQSTYAEKSFFLYPYGLWRNGQSLTITEEMLNMPVAVYGTVGTTTISKIMINKGSTAFPYFPYFYSFYQYGNTLGYHEGYDVGREDGIDKGYKDGYEQGYTNGLGTLQNSIFWKMAIVGEYVDSNGTSHYLNIAPNAVSHNNMIFENNALLLSETIKQYLSWEPEDEQPVKWAQLSLLWEGAGNKIPLSVFNVSGTASNDIIFHTRGPFLRLDNGDFLPWGWHTSADDSKVYNLFITDAYRQTYGNVFVRELELYRRSEDYLGVSYLESSLLDDNIKLFDSNTGFFAGYDYGFNEGFKSGKFTGEQTAQQNAFDKGYDKGKTDGINSANKYSFDGLLSAVFDVPVRTITSVLDFDLLGINLKTFFFSLLTVCVIISVVKLFI